MHRYVNKFSTCADVRLQFTCRKMVISSWFPQVFCTFTSLGRGIGNASVWGVIPVDFWCIIDSVCDHLLGWRYFTIFADFGFPLQTKDESFIDLQEFVADKFKMSQYREDVLQAQYLAIFLRYCTAPFLILVCEKRTGGLEKTLVNFRKKSLRVGEKKIGSVGQPETQLFFFWPNVVFVVEIISM